MALFIIIASTAGSVLEAIVMDDGPLPTKSGDVIMETPEQGSRRLVVGVVQRDGDQVVAPERKFRWNVVSAEATARNLVRPGGRIFAKQGWNGRWKDLTSVDHGPATPLPIPPVKHDSTFETVIAAAPNRGSEDDLLATSLDPDDYHAAISMSLAVAFGSGTDNPANRLETYVRREFGAIRDVAVLCPDEQDVSLSIVGVQLRDGYAVSMLLTLRLDRLSPEVVVLDHVEVAGSDLGEIAATIVDRLQHVAFRALRQMDGEGTATDHV